MSKRVALAAVGSVSLFALAVAFPAQGVAQRGHSQPLSLSERPGGSFTPAVRDPRLAAALARRRIAIDVPIRFTPAATAEERNRSVRVAVRVSPNVQPVERSRPTPAAAAPPMSAPSLVQITPSSYNLGVSLGWRRFGITGDLANTRSDVVPSGRESARIGVDYRANRRLTGRVAVAAERSDGVERIVAEDQTLSLDVGGSYSIARNIDVSAGARYRLPRDRLEPLAQSERRDSQAVYIGTSFRF